VHKRLDNIPQDARATAWGGGENPTDADVSRLPVLLIVHQEQSSPGQVGNWFRANGYPLDIRRPRFGDPLPETLDGHTGAVIFGGPQSANDTDDFIRREVDWIGVALNEKKPFLGICLGAQMLAVHLGGKVASHPEGYVEVGYYPIAPTLEGQALMEWPDHVYQWHREGFCTPETGTRLAGSELFNDQAFRCGTAFGLQFHPEITHWVMNRWVTRSSYRCVMPGARPAQTHKANHMLHGPRQRAWLDQFLTSWVATPADAQAMQAAG